MGSFHLWHPAYVLAEPLTLEAYVTLGDAILPPGDAAAVTEAATAALDLGLTWRDPRLEPVRTHYFSSSRGQTGDWQDDWAVVWRLRATILTGQEQALAEPPGWGYVDLDVGASAPADDDTWPCVVIADAADAGVIDAAKRRIRASHPDAELRHGKAFARYPQLRCDLGERPRSWFADGAEEAEVTLAMLAERGLSVRFDGLDAVRRGSR